jgi:transcriptional regulator with XRE-family HTH domain
MNNYRKKIGSLIKETRLSRGMTQSEFALGLVKAPSTA